LNLFQLPKTRFVFIEVDGRQQSVGGRLDAEVVLQEEHFCDLSHVSGIIFVHARCIVR